MIWIKSKYPENSRAKGRLIVWGHSLGTAVSSHLVSWLHHQFWWVDTITITQQLTPSLTNCHQFCCCSPLPSLQQLKPTHIYMMVGTWSTLTVLHLKQILRSCQWWKWLKIQVANLCQQQLRPSALVLEAPFNNIFDEVELERMLRREGCQYVQVRNHPMGWLWRKMPFYDWFFTVPLRSHILYVKVLHISTYFTYL